jgi:hypothetical protein
MPTKKKISRQQYLTYAPVYELKSIILFLFTESSSTRPALEFDSVRGHLFDVILYTKAAKSLDILVNMYI